LPTFGHYRSAGFSIADKGYIGTGSANNTWSNDFWQYDTVFDSWTQKADFGGIKRQSAIGFAVGNYGYIALGDSGNTPAIYFNDIWEYDPANNTWTQKTNFPGTARTRAVAFSIGNKGYVATGYTNGPTYFRDLWEYDPTLNSWTQKANMPTGTNREGAAAFAVNGMGYVGTGRDGSGFKQDFYEYNPIANVWTQKANILGGVRNGAVGFNVGCKGYVATGFNGGLNPTNVLYEYDPSTNTWTQRANYGCCNDSQGLGITIGNVGYLIGGQSAGNQNWAYYPILTYTPAVSFSVNDTFICETQCINFTSTTANNPNSWAWSFPGGTPSSSSAQNPSNICYSSSGLYSVTLIASNCAGSDTLILNNYINVQVCTSIDELDESQSIVYPNPSEGIFNLEMSGFGNLKMESVDVYNLMGECVYHLQISQSPNLQINLSSQAKGIYFIKVIADDKVYSQKVVISPKG